MYLITKLSLPVITFPAAGRPENKYADNIRFSSRNYTVIEYSRIKPDHSVRFDTVDLSCIL